MVGRPDRLTYRCPACGCQTLMIDNAGWLVCSWLSCRNPGALHDIIEAAIACIEHGPPTGGGNQQPSEVRADPVAPRASGDDTRDTESLSSTMAAGLLLMLKAECEAQHARADNAEADVLRVQARVQELEADVATWKGLADTWTANFNRSEQFQSGPTKRAEAAEADVLRLRAERDELRQYRDRNIVLGLELGQILGPAYDGTNLLDMARELVESTADTVRLRAAIAQLQHENE